MSTHTPVEVEILASSDCVAEECEHEVECPTFLCVVCLECNAATQGTDDVGEWEGSVTACPIFGTGAPREQVDSLLSALTAGAPDRTDGGQ